MAMLHYKHSAQLARRAIFRGANATAPVRANVTAANMPAACALATQPARAAALATGAVFGAVVGFTTSAVQAAPWPVAAAQADCPPFDPDGFRFDQNNFSGRLQQISATLECACPPLPSSLHGKQARRRKLLQPAPVPTPTHCARLPHDGGQVTPAPVRSPMKLLVSDASIMEAKALLAKARAGESTGATDAELWAAKELVECRVHPDTGELIFAPFCFAAYTPAQPPIIVGLLWPGSWAVHAFWQWANQSFNAAVFYSNKNASTPMSDMEIFAAYCAAVSSAIVVSGGMKTAAAKLGSGTLAGKVVGMYAPFCGVVLAGCTNLLCMRNDELFNGVVVKDASGKEYGKSKAAAREGLAKCCAARLFWNIPILGCTPLLTGAYYSTAFFAANPWTRIPAEVFFGTAMLMVGVYPAQAVFSQKATIPAARLEPEFQGLGVEEFVYNKGL